MRIRHPRKKADLLLFGDSLTEWGPWHDLLSDFRLINRGISGDTTRDMLARVHATLTSKPDLVLVMAGINDLLQAESVSAVLPRYRQLVQSWRDRDLPVLVQSTLYVGANLVSLNPLVAELNRELELMCESDPCLNFVDLNSVLCPQGVLPTEHSQDGVHLTPLAYQRWQQQILPLLHK